MKKKPLILVVGDIIVDRYLYTKQTRSNPEGTAPLVDIEREEICLGGAANVARNITKLGCDCILAGSLDNSWSFDDRVIDDLFEQNNIRYKHLLKSAFGATIKTRIILNGESLLRIDDDNK